MNKDFQKFNTTKIAYFEKFSATTGGERGHGPMSSLGCATGCRFKFAILGRQMDNGFGFRKFLNFNMRLGASWFFGDER